MLVRYTPLVPDKDKRAITSLFLDEAAIVAARERMKRLDDALRRIGAERQPTKPLDRLPEPATTLPVLNTTSLTSR
jgi:hypothetical protein